MHSYENRSGYRIESGNIVLSLYNSVINYVISLRVMVLDKQFPSRELFESL